jgi:hypothetical protein
MLFTIVLLPLAVSAAVLEQRDSAASSRTNVTSEKLQPRYRKTANRNLYKVGRKC